MVLLGCLAIHVHAADLAHRWSFNGDLTDSIGGQDAVLVDDGANDGTLSATEITLSGGAKGSSDYIDLGSNTFSGVGDSVTIETWATQHSVQNWSRIFDFGASTAENVFMSWTQGTNLNADRVEWLGPADNTVDTTNAPYTLDTEFHIAAVFEPGSVTWYSAPSDSEDLGPAKGSFNTTNTVSTLDDTNCWLGQSQWPDATANASWNEFRLWNGALTQDELEKLHDMGPDGLKQGVAANPGPTDQAADVMREASLSWSPSKVAATHDVYLGLSGADVNEASRTNPLDVLAVQDHDVSSFDPEGRFDFGQTYYWRVDEVNGAPDYTIFKGEIWSFTVEPFSYPITSITATASSSFGANTGPEKTIDGSGLNELDQHSMDGSAMWTSGAGVVPAWIQYEFDSVLKLDEMWVWNSNQIIEAFMGLGAKDVFIETSVDGTEWTVLEGATLFNQAPGSPTYTANTTIDFGGALAKFVKITINSGYGLMPQYSISEVRFFSIPAAAREPEPADGATVGNVDVVLTWRAGREAGSHEVYLGSDPTDLTLLGSSMEANYDLSGAGLEYGTTYYWQINEVNDVEVPASYLSDIWSFTTQDYFAVDDFESYDDDCHRIFFAWQDGWGHNGGESIDDCDVPAYGGNGTGAIVGADQAPFAEKTIVHSGSQSMPMGYDGAGSEAQREFTAPQDWTKGGAQFLALSFAGNPVGNASGDVYVKINGVKKVVSPTATALQSPVWSLGIVDLASVSTNLSSVRNLAVGVDSSGTGTVYIDDIRLYPVAPEVLVPVDPGTGNLQALYAMENNLQDSTGSGYDGTTPDLAASYTDGPMGLGTALALAADDFAQQYVELPIGPLVSRLRSSTFAAWVDYVSAGDNWVRIFDFGNSNSAGYMFLCPSTGTGGGPLRFAITPTGGGGESFMEAPRSLPAGWHHVAVAIDAVSMTMQLYLDGAVVAQGATGTLPADLGNTTQNWLGRSQYDADGLFTGGIDDLRIYDRALSQEEILYLAGAR